ncbi:MAG TPA: sulfotransferase [Candidatus Binatia bacterium]|nr:sulfotransferase [Candidatus Binatia bacterium]
MASLKRQALRATQEGLVRVKRKIDDLLTADPAAPRTPYVARLSEAYARGWEGCPCAFVLSTGRAGSKTLTALFALSSRIVSEHEPDPRLVKASFDAYLEGPAIADSEKWRAVVYAARDDLVCEANRRGRIYVETNNRLTYLAPVLARCFPASRFIHLHRHPYEVVRSGMRRGYYESHNWDFARVRPRPGEPMAAAWDALPRLEKVAWYWARVNGESHAFVRSLPEGRGFDLNADALFAGDERTLRALFQFVGVEFPPVELVEEVLGQKINAAVRGSYPVPAEWTDEDRAAVWRQVGPTAEVLGYRA